MVASYRKAYTQFVSREIHVQSKVETLIVEGYNSLFRHFLAIFWQGLSGNLNVLFQKCKKTKESRNYADAQKK